MWFNRNHRIWVKRIRKLSVVWRAFERSARAALIVDCLNQCFCSSKTLTLVSEYTPQCSVTCIDDCDVVGLRGQREITKLSGARSGILVHNDIGRIINQIAWFVRTRNTCLHFNTKYVFSQPHPSSSGFKQQTASVAVGHLDHVWSYGVRKVVSAIPDEGNIVGWVFHPTRWLVRFSHLNMPFIQNSEFI